MSDSALILIVIAGISLLLFLIIRSKLHAFVALLLVSLLVGAAAGMPLDKVIESIQNGMGGTLGFVAVVVGLGAMFGQMLEVSGGAERLAQTLINKFGENKAQWALGLTGFIVAIPVFFDVGFIILVPIVYGLARKTGRSLLYYGIPLLAGLAVTHSFVPPTPGPIAVADLIGADLGWVILFGFIAGLPAMIVAGPLFGKYIAKKIHATVPDYMDMKEKQWEKDLPGFGTIAGIIFIPLVLILLNTVSGAVLPEGNGIRTFLTFLGHPFVALTIATLLAFYLLGQKRGFTKQEVQDIATKSLEPAGIIILVTGAGGVFKQILIDSGVGKVLADMMATSSLPPIVLAFLIAAIVRVSQGSATVAMVTAAGLIAPLIETLGLSGPILGMIVIAIAAGATILSHVNDSGFWLVNRYFGLDVKDTLKSWTVMETLIALVGFVVVLILSLFVS
ncbi:MULTISPECIES: GntP family permease [Geobacillus]|jgi:Gnt-I system low-affinity gluconate transporter|uniref:Low-affinity gluconate transporter n=1 Tax=Geobacillus thermodenitrificans (strain NG80-2) TaxID=420246 RepID=A4IPE1_GEOTN|nr:MULTISPECIES: GntP family permease [Geobacillus]ABO67195.1 Low-affinity gluconate transporter [Geobacillus thermodenitrificans NG80-2]ARP42990.1 Low-affinity gluconate transporter [Geobacillus thermodenitrificans]KQB93130.1 Gluconate permease [Geobacillus sp. PA-3]MED3905169.1 GntP family permease [Geobacillus thermodenitrificans]MED4916544.1 GntP family permease [Geobacillus thermodenitrificans]